MAIPNIAAILLSPALLMPQPSSSKPPARNALDSTSTAARFPVRLTIDSGLVWSTPVSASKASLLQEGRRADKGSKVKARGRQLFPAAIPCDISQLALSRLLWDSVTLAVAYCGKM